MSRECLFCKTDISHRHLNSKYCSKECSSAHGEEKLIKSSHEKYPTENRDAYAECSICKFRAKNLQIHIKSKHDMTVAEYREIYKTETMCVDSRNTLSKRMQGSNNPGYQHGGRLSPWSDKSGRSVKQIEESKARAKEDRYNPTQLQYWMNQGYSEEDAHIKQSERQQTFSLEICIEKYGDVEGPKVFAERQKKWLEALPKLNYSMISQELFWELDAHVEGAFFAQKDPNGVVDDSGKNYEKRIKTSHGAFSLDFLYDKKVIEFDGDYWHSEARVNPEREKRREKAIMSEGYVVHRVREQDYKKDKEKVIQECLKFLKG